MPLFGKGKQAPVPTPAAPAAGEAPSEEFTLKLYYASKCSDQVRVKSTPGVVARLARMLEGYTQSQPELVEPYPVELNEAAPFIHRMPEAAEWLTYHRKRSPVTRHALVVLEATDAVDLAFDTLVCCLLDGNTDTSGYPDYNAIVGGVASHWDEESGDLVVRAVVGWGGRGVRNDSDRKGSGIMSGILNNILSDPAAMGVVAVDRPTVGSKREGKACPHCGFTGHETAFYCPKCGMKLRG